jgi:hypothetical protein
MAQSELQTVINGREALVLRINKVTVPVIDIHIKCGSPGHRAAQEVARIHAAANSPRNSGCKDGSLHSIKHRPEPAGEEFAKG